MDNYWRCGANLYMSGDYAEIVFTKNEIYKQVEDNSYPFGIVLIDDKKVEHQISENGWMFNFILCNKDGAEYEDD